MSTWARRWSASSRTERQQRGYSRWSVGSQIKVASSTTPLARHLYLSIIHKLYFIFVYINGFSCQRIKTTYPMFLVRVFIRSKLTWIFI